MLRLALYWRGASIPWLPPPAGASPPLARASCALPTGSSPSPPALCGVVAGSLDATSRTGERRPAQRHQSCHSRTAPPRRRSQRNTVKGLPASVSRGNVADASRPQGPPPGAPPWRHSADSQSRYPPHSPRPKTVADRGRDLARTGRTIFFLSGRPSAAWGSAMTH